MPDLTLVKNDLNPETLQRVIRIQLDSHLLRHLTAPQIRAVYSELEGARDALSKVLDRADGKT